MTDQQDDQVIPDYADPLIDAARVEVILRDVLYAEAEVTEDDMDERGLPKGALFAEGIVNSYAFHPDRLEQHRIELSHMLQNLPKEFRTNELGGDGGWSFLNACQDANDVQWTGLHQTQEQLLCMGIALDMAAWLMPREYWGALPGGMPYVVVKV